MTQENKFTAQQIHPATKGKRMLQGASIGLVLISIFLIGAGKPDPAWGKLWLIKPLLMVPFAGAMGGLFYYFMDHLRSQGGWRKAVAIVVSLIVFVFGLWIGAVLGLNGTFWD
jgi:hypothetical protein